jgi:RNA polymerase sigma-70 factor, ECF subfamily
MAERDWLAGRFEGHRAHLRAVAYRMLGSLTEADGQVHEAWLRLSRRDERSLECVRTWMTTFVAGLCLTTLRARSSQRETRFDEPVPGPIVDRADRTERAHEESIADSVTLAVLAVLDTLSPDERLAVVLHDVFAVPLDQIAPTLECSTESAKQLLSGARRSIRDQPHGWVGNGAGRGGS